MPCGKLDMPVPGFVQHSLIKKMPLIIDREPSRDEQSSDAVYQWRIVLGVCGLHNTHSNGKTEEWQAE